MTKYYYLFFIVFSYLYHTYMVISCVQNMLFCATFS